MKEEGKKPSGFFDENEKANVVDLRTQKEDTKTDGVDKKKNFFSFVKFLIPNYRVGDKSLRENSNEFFTAPEFRSLRAALFAIIAVVVFASSSFVYFLNDADKTSAAGWYSGDWEQRRKITIDNTRVEGSTNLTNFPVFIYASTTDWRTTANGGDMQQDDGLEILFTSSDGTTKIDHEIESYASTTGEIVAWVEIPTLDYNDDTDIYIYYGNDAGGLDEQNATSTWNSNYVGVYHMAEDPSINTDGDCGGSTEELCDSTDNDNDMEMSGGMVSGNLEDGKIGKAIHFDNSDDHFNVNVGTLNAPWTIEAWAYFDQATQGGGDYDYIAMLDSTGTNSDGSLSRFAGTNLFYNYDGSAARTGSALTGQVWVHLVLRATTSSPYYDLYVNGSPDAIQASANNGDSTGEFTIGQYDTSSTHQMDGLISEVRLSNINLSDGWIETTYNSENSPSTFYTIDSEEIYNATPDTPTNSSPANASTSVAIAATLTSSAFSDDDAGEVHQASQWQVGTSSSFSLALYDSGATTTALASITLPNDLLTASTTYYWKVRHQDDDSAWSNYSSETSFTTDISWYNVQWQYRIPFEINPSQVSGSSDLSEFPVLLDLSDMGTHFWSNADEDGDDLLITSRDGTTKLYRELESIATSTETGALWFNSSSDLSYATNTPFFLYYGNSGASETNDTQTWDSDFIAVHHLEETDVDNGANDITDSTSNDNDGTTYTMDTNDQVSGQINGSLDFDGGSDAIDLGDIEMESWTELTVSSWFQSSESGTNMRLIAKDQLGVQGNFILWYSTSNRWEFIVFDDNLGNWQRAAYNSTAPNDGNWHHIAGVVSQDSNQALLYIDGVEVASDDFTATTLDDTDNEEVVLGADSDVGSFDVFLDGGLDEVRISDTARSVGWLVTEFNNQNSPSTFYATSTYQSSPNSSPNQPTNSSPANGATNQSLSPVLSAGAFSDPNPGDTHSNSQWQISSTSGDYGSPAYDSGATSTALTSVTVPSGNLSSDTTYYWQVRYQDNNNGWSTYSSETSFDTSVTPGTPTHSSPADGVNDQVINPTLTSSAFSDSDAGSSHQATQWLVRSSSDSSYSSPVYDSGASTTALTSVNIPVGTLSENSIYYWKLSHQDEHGVWSATSTETSFVTGLTSISVVAIGATEYQSGETAKLVVQVTDADGDPINDATVVMDFFDVSGTKTGDDVSMTYVTSSDGLYSYSTTTSSTEGVYTYSIKATKNSDSSYSSHTFHVSPGLNNLDQAISSATSSIISELQSEIQSASTSLAAVITTEIQSASSSLGAKLDTLEGKIDTITSTLNTVNTNLGAVQSTVNSIRTSQQNLYELTLSDVSEVQAGNTYRARFTIEDFETNPTNASSTPSIVIYDSTRAMVQATTSLTSVDTGIYEFSTTTASNATTGLWESVVTASVGGDDLTRNDYWQVTGAPAQVVVNSMSDLIIDEIVADVSIQNEGNAAFEYQYEWCVVESESNQCGGDDDVYYGSAAKLINAGATFNTDLTSTVPNVGDYYFKMVVYFGTESSGASRSFTAISESGQTNNSSSGSSNTNSTRKEIAEARRILELQANDIRKLLELVGDVDTSDPSFKTLLDISEEQTQGVKGVQNKLADLKALSSITQRMVEERGSQPLVETYMKFNSVEVHFLITNPSDEENTVKFKSFLPTEVRPEHIMDLNGLTLEYDPAAETHYVSGDILLGPNETITKKVEIEDIWISDSSELASIKSEAEDLADLLSGTQYDAQATLLANDIYSRIDAIRIKEKEGYVSPQQHILAYRENQANLKGIEADIEKLRDLTVQSGVSRGLLGSIGGIQTFATWGIVLAIVLGFALLAGIIFAMWRHQMKLLQSVSIAGVKNVVAKGAPVKEIETEEEKPKDTAVKVFFVQLVIRLVVVVLSLVFLGWLAVVAIGYVKDFGKTEVYESSNAKTYKNNQVATPEVSEEIIEPKNYLRINDTPTNFLNVRSKPSLEGEVLIKVYPEEQYEFKQQEGKWFEIVLNDGTKGWVFGDYVSVLDNG